MIYVGITLWLIFCIAVGGVAMNFAMGFFRGLKRFVCEQCGRKFRLKEHQGIGLSNYCPECSKKKSQEYEERSRAAAEAADPMQYAMKLLQNPEGRAALRKLTMPSQVDLFEEQDTRDTKGDEWPEDS